MLLAMLLSACGFQLRGSVELPTHLSPMLVDGPSQQDPLREELAGLLENGGLSLTDDARSAASRLRILGQESRRRVLSVDNRGKAAEYLLQQEVRFTLLDKGGEAVIPEQSLSVERSYVHSVDQVLGKQNEQAMLREEMRRDLAGRILTRLRALASRKP
jgi:LPS-assembly lipoprotein